MKHMDRNETNRDTAIAAAEDRTTEGGNNGMEKMNEAWHADCFGGAAQERIGMEHDGTNTDMEHDDTNTDKEQNTNGKNVVLLSQEEIDMEMTVHEGLVRRLADRIAGGCGAEVDDDLLQEARIGLWKGLRRFDKARGLQQSTYVAWWIRRGIFRELEQRRRYTRFFTASLQDPVGEDGDATLGDLYANTQAADPAEESGWEDEREAVRERMETLRPGDRETLELYYGLRDGTPRTLKEVGRLRGVSTTRVHKIICRARDRLTPPPAA